MFVYGAGIQAGTTVVSASGRTVALSLPAAISGIEQGRFQVDEKSASVSVHHHRDRSDDLPAQFDTTNFGPFFGKWPGLLVSVHNPAGRERQRSRRLSMSVCGRRYTGFVVRPDILRSTDYKTWYFDKTVSGQTDGSGNAIPGAWMFSATPSQSAVAHSGDVPIEVCVALINELNAMSPAHTIGMWMNIPSWGLSSMDPDYSTASDWAVNAVDVVMNPSSKVRASGFSALGYSGATHSISQSS